jgi:DNA-binding response OmpR family regulator
VTVSEQNAFVESTPGVPPIILFVDDDRDTLDLYGGYFETNGLWVVTTTDPDEAMEVAVDLGPNLIVADLGFADQALGIEFVCQVKADEQLRATPVIVLSGRPKEDLQESRRCGADIVVPKPCPPQDLLDRARTLLRVSRELRERSHAAAERGQAQREQTATILGRGGELTNRAVVRRCPSCATPLEWAERAKLEGEEYDYFRWCPSGCGLYCYKPGSGHWIKLA